VLIQKAKARGEINDAKICTNALIISHLLFADDCYMFFYANTTQASGQAINLEKSEIFCSRNVLRVEHNNISNILGVQAVLGAGKYLGLPSMISRSKKSHL